MENNGIQLISFWPYIVILKWKPKDTALKGGKIFIPDSAKSRMSFPHGKLVSVFNECPLEEESDIWVNPKIRALVGASREEVEEANLHLFYGSYVGQEMNSGAIEGSIKDELYDIVKVDQILGEIEGEVY